MPDCAMSPCTPDEHWFPVPGWEPFYEAGCGGHVRSLARLTASGVKGGRLLKAYPQGNGYLTVNLSRPGGHRQQFALHRLIGETFIGELPDGQQTRHKNGDKSDCAAWNLEYGTSAENHDDMKRHGTDPAGTRNPRAKLTEDDVRLIRSLLVARSTTQIALAAHYDVSQAVISALALRKTWKHVA